MALLNTHQETTALLDRLDENAQPIGSSLTESRVGGVRIHDGDNETSYAAPGALIHRRTGGLAVEATLRLSRLSPRTHNVRARITQHPDGLPILTLSDVFVSRGNKSKRQAGPKETEVAARALSTAARRLEEAGFPRR